MRLESGTCNVCSAPCSSCMHLNHALKRPKPEDFFDENCCLGEANNNHCSVDEGNVSSLRSHAISETSNIIGITSSHDSVSENAESGQTLSNKYKDSKSVDVPDENNSCVSRGSYTYLLNNSHTGNNDAGSSQRLYVQSQSDKFLSGDLRLMHRERDLCSHVPEMSECSVENSNSSLTKKREPVVYFGEKSIANTDSLVDCTAKVSSKVCPKSEADSDNDVCDVKYEERDGSVRDGQHEKAEELVKLPGVQEPQSEHDSDRSDPMEHDVQSCDICGDAGREDQLAICSRCSDGAEHIYCMRVMLQKVPEGDWLCEECQYEKDTENQRQNVEEKKSLTVSSSSQVARKRISVNMEIAPASKRQTLESSSTSPKMSSPKKLAQLSRESSFKSLDKGKLKPCHQVPTRNCSGGDDKEIVRSLSIGHWGQPSKSTLLKSSSFNNSISKPRVKLLDEVAPPKPKHGGEHTSKTTEMSVRMTSKSTLFKSPSLGHSSATESKVKMILPSKSATSQELKGPRLSKESGGFDRKLPCRIDRSAACSSMATSVFSTPKGDQKLKPRGETIEPSAVNINRDLKDNLGGKVCTLPKSTSNISHKSWEPQVSSETMSSSVDEALQDVLPQSPKTANQDVKTRDSSRNCMTLAVPAALKSPFCHKRKEFDHSLECCTAGSTHAPGAQLSVTTLCNSKEKHKGNKLKESIQMALLRKPEIYKKKEVPSETGDLSTLGTDPDCEVRSQDQVLVSGTLKNSLSADETHEQQEIPGNSTPGSSKCLCANDLKQLNCCQTEFCSQPGSDSIGLTAGKPVVRDLSNNALEISSFLSRMSPIPEYDYIWQGVFELHRNGKPPNSCNGIQAHLSSCASPKVLEVVSKFLPKLPLDEVSRLSTWPSQFRQGGAKEYNIALYFFANDIESYETHYKGLLDHMIRNDLALKGKFDGVELVIFPSNQLPENSQSWNMLFFLWGIFRVTRMDHFDSARNICIPRLNAVPAEEDSSTAVLTLSEMHCSPKPVDEVSIASDKTCSEFPSSTSVDQGQITVCMNVYINDRKHFGSQGNLEKQDSRINSQSTSAVPKISTLLFQEMKSTGSSQNDSIGNQEEGAANTISKDNISARIDCDDNQQASKRKQNDDCCIDLEATISGREEGAASNIGKDKIPEKMVRDEDQQCPKRKQKENNHYIDLEATLPEDPTIEEVNCQLPDDKVVQYASPNEVNGKTEDGRSSSKKLKTPFGGIYGSSVEDGGCEKACDEKIICGDLGLIERTFFPVSDSQLDLNSISMKGPHEYRDGFQHGFPNLDLDLGGKTEPPPPPKGMLSFLFGEVDKKNIQENNPHILAERQEEDVDAASLSLSLAFPSSNKEHKKTVSKVEAFPSSNNSPPFLLFGRLTDK